MVDQLRRNLVHRERTSCIFDELEEDNDYNRVIKGTLRLLKSHAHRERTRRQVEELIGIFDQVADREVNSKTVDSLPMNRMVQRYKRIFEYCSLFLSDKLPDVTAGEIPCICMLFDMNKLFEAYTTRLVLRAVRSLGFRGRAQGPQRFLGTLRDHSSQVFKLKPDICILDSDNEVVMICDAKWKILDHTESKLGVSEADMYQMIAYGTRYNCSRLALIYPNSSEEARGEKTFEIGNSDLTVDIFEIDLNDPAEILQRIQEKLKGILQPVSAPA